MTCFSHASVLVLSFSVGSSGRRPTGSEGYHSADSQQGVAFTGRPVAMYILNIGCSNLRHVYSVSELRMEEVQVSGVTGALIQRLCMPWRFHKQR